MSDWKLIEGDVLEFQIVYRMVNDQGETREMYRAKLATGWVYITASANSRGGRSESAFFVPGK